MSPQLTYESAHSSTTYSCARAKLLNKVEPDGLVDAFMNNPPVGFQSIQVRCGNRVAPAFLADFDLLTTLAADYEVLRKFLKVVPIARRFFKFKTLFVGTTTTEYSTYPEQSDYKGLISALLQEARKRGAQLLIIKDIPKQSPLLGAVENESAVLLQRQSREAACGLVEGQALAYVPIDFSSIDEYMLKLSKTRRKEFRKKIKESAHVQIEELSCGGSSFFDEAFLTVMYSMYQNVFAQSEIQFDVLTKEFFRRILQDTASGGKVFCYKIDGRLIGYNICFVHNGMLLDKYVGFVYPEARDANLYFLSWFYNLEYAIRHRLKFYVAGWTDPAVKKSLGAKFTMTNHAVFVRNPILREMLRPFIHVFEADSNWMEHNA
jgi:hypothetical protein